MSLLRIIYSSQPFGFDAGSLAGILLDARRCNARDGVTGALICRRDVFLQLLEGPERAVRDTFARIVADDRHTDVVPQVSEAVAERLFAGWAMHHDPARSWLAAGADPAEDHLAHVREADVRAIFARLAANLARPEGD